MGEDPSTATLTGLLSERARRSPNQEFLRFGDESWTFAEIDAWTTRRAWEQAEHERTLEEMRRERTELLDRREAAGHQRNHTHEA